MVGIETGSATSQTATTQTTNRSTTTQKTNTAQATGESTTSQTSSGRPDSTLSATSCGSPSDSGGRFVLWDKVQVCEEKKTQPQTNCLVNDSDYVVLNGGANTTHDYLLVPTRRVSGIECPLIWDQNAPNYWQDAWMQATKTGGAAEVNYPHLPRSGLPSPRFVRWGLPRSTTRLADSPGIHSGLTLRRRGFGPSHAYLSALRSACEGLSFQLLYYHAQYRFVSIVHQAIARLRTTKTAGVSPPYPLRSLRKGPYPPAIQVNSTQLRERAAADREDIGASRKRRVVHTQDGIALCAFENIANERHSRDEDTGGRRPLNDAQRHNYDERRRERHHSASETKDHETGDQHLPPAKTVSEHTDKRRQNDTCHKVGADEETRLRVADTECVADDRECGCNERDAQWR